jgi:hypothetical protein
LMARRLWRALKARSIPCCGPPLARNKFKTHARSALLSRSDPRIRLLVSDAPAKESSVDPQTVPLPGITGIWLVPGESESETAGGNRHTSLRAIEAVAG